MNMNMNDRIPVINYYPRPIALAYNRLVNQVTHPMEKFFAILDTVEALTHCITTLEFMYYIRQEKKCLNLNKEISNAIRRPLSFGTILNIGQRIEKTLSKKNGCPENICPEMKPIFNFIKENHKNINEFVEMRNSKAAHSYVRVPSLFKQDVDEILPKLDKLLENASFLQDIVWIIPSEYQGDDLVCCNQYIGIHRYENKVLEPKLCIKDEKAYLPENRSLIAHFKGSDFWIPLYPFYLYQQVSEGKEGMYFISNVSEIDDKKRIGKGRIEVKNSKYNSYEEKLISEKQDPTAYKQEKDAWNHIMELLGVCYGARIRSFIPKTQETKDYTLLNNLVKYFDGRKIKEGYSWKNITEDVAKFFKSSAFQQIPEPIELYFDCHLSIAYYAGHITKPKENKACVMVPVQKERDGSENEYDYPEDWSDMSNLDLWNVEIPKEQENEIVVAIAVARDMKQDISVFLKDYNLKPGFYFSMKDGSQNLPASLAWKYARKVQQILEENIQRDKCKKIHLLIAAPVSFSYVLAQELHGIISEIQLYEYGFEGRTGYAPSILVDFSHLNLEKK